MKKMISLVEEILWFFSFSPQTEALVLRNEDCAFSQSFAVMQYSIVQLQIVVRMDHSYQGMKFELQTYIRTPTYLQ